MRVPRYTNKLWIARKKVGLPQKCVARLLGHRTLSVISEYETGKLLPNLRTALKLSVIYHTSVCELYPDLRAEIEKEIGKAQPQAALTQKHHQLPIAIL